MSFRRVLTTSFLVAAMLPAVALARPLPQAAQLTGLSSALKSGAPCALSGAGKAALGGAVGVGAATAAKKAGVKNAEMVGLVISTLLTDKIACLLDGQEQHQAATATQNVVQQAVGSKVAWTSATRPNVTGVSSVLSETKKPDGSLCRLVRDVVIVGGEETTVSKTLCRAVGATGFTLPTVG
jgi:surface antigen